MDFSANTLKVKCMGEEYSELAIESLGKKMKEKRNSSLKTARYPIKKNNQQTLQILCSHYNGPENKI